MLQPKDMGLPVHAYLARDEVREDGTEKSKQVFVNLPTEVGATEAEEIGVEHLLRDVKDAAVSTLSSEVRRALWWRHHAARELGGSSGGAGMDPAGVDGAVAGGGFNAALSFPFSPAWRHCPDTLTPSSGLRPAVR